MSTRNLLSGYKSVYLFLLLIFTIAINSANAQTKTKIVWDYPVKPNMEEWSLFKSMEDMYKTCQIPEDILKQIDTESLVDICLNFPVPPVFPLFNTPQQGFMEYYNNFNGIHELFHRKDVAQYLVKRYVMMSLSEFNPLWPSYKQGQFISHYKFVEAILSQPQVIASLDAEGRKVLLKETIRKLDEKISMDDLFSGFSLEINLWVIANLLYAENKSIFGEYNQHNIQTAIETGMFVDIDMNKLYQQAKNYIYENE